MLSIFDTSSRSLTSASMRCRSTSGIAAAAVDEEIIEADKEGPGGPVGAFRIRFASDFKIVALPGVARALRGKQGIFIGDEAGFYKNLAEVLKAAMAFLIWGGQVIIVSTHDGVDNPFNLLLDEIRAGRRKGETLTFTAADFLARFALPNFFFHVVTAYGILRHQGVPLGKMDYLAGGAVLPT